VRIFVGVELSDEVKDAASSAADALRRRLADAGLRLDAKWVPRDNLHITLWFIGEVKDAANDYDGPGVNHIAIGAQSQAEVDATAAYLSGRGVPALFETPRHRPEFSQGPDQTYYQVMFESPDRVLFEVVYTGPQQG